MSQIICDYGLLGFVIGRGEGHFTPECLQSSIRPGRDRVQVKVHRRPTLPSLNCIHVFTYEPFTVSRIDLSRFDLLISTSPDPTSVHMSRRLYSRFTRIET